MNECVEDTEEKDQEQEGERVLGEERGAEGRNEEERGRNPV